MDTSTGEIKTNEEWIKEMGRERFEEWTKSGRLIGVSKQPNPRCPKCHGKGFSKQWWQKKVKPCKCIT